MSNEISFRRIKGRIVPIKLTKGQKDALKTAGAAAAGAAATVALSAASGMAYSKMITTAGNMTIKNISEFSKSRGYAAGILNRAAQGLRAANAPMKPVFDAGQYGLRGLKGFASRSINGKSINHAISLLGKGLKRLK